MEHAKQRLPVAKWLPWIFVVFGAVGWLASTGLMLDRIALLEDPDATVVCDVNPFVNCGGILEAGYGTTFGVPDPLIGIAGFSALITIGVVLLAGAQLRRWFWLILQGGVVGGIGFTAWLYYLTLYQIGVLCPYCMAVWVATIPIFWYVTLYNLRQGYLGETAADHKAVAWASRHHLDVLLAIYLLLAVNLAWQFRDALLSWLG